MRIFFGLSTLLLLFCALCGQLLSKESDVSWANLPPKVQSAFKNLVRGGKVTGTTSDREKDGTLLYEVTYTVRGRKFEAEVSPDGQLLVVDEQIALREAPRRVAETITRETAGGRIVKIEKATKGSEVFYEAEFRRGGKDHEVRVAPAGKLIERE